MRIYYEKLLREIIIIIMKLKDTLESNLCLIRKTLKGKYQKFSSYFIWSTFYPLWN